MICNQISTVSQQLLKFIKKFVQNKKQRKHLIVVKIRCPLFSFSRYNKVFILQYNSKTAATSGNIFYRDRSLAQIQDLFYKGKSKTVPLLFMGTVADNIRYARPDATMEEVIQAAKSANAHDFIMKLPEGYDTVTGSGGVSLSGGEKQRISIARALIQKPNILILDEATAAMDTATERKIQSAIDNLKSGRTIIAIAHRLSTLRDADKLYVIEHGEVKESGTHDELIRTNGKYFELYKLQSESLKSVGLD